MNHHSCVALSALVLATVGIAPSLSAQAPNGVRYSPPSAGSEFGSIPAENLRWGASLSQQVMGASTIAPNIAILRKLEVRHYSASVGYAPGVRRLAVRLGLAARSPGNMSATFSQNRKGSLTTVFSGAYSFPPCGSVTVPVSTFQIGWGFNQPFTYVAKQGDLLLEIDVQEPFPQNSSAGYYGYELDGFADLSGSIQNFGSPGKLSSGEWFTTLPALWLMNSPLLAQPGSSFPWLVQAPANTPVRLYVGLSRDSWGQVKLPLDLTSLGAPGNSMHVSPDFFIPAASTGTYGSFNVNIPNAPGIAGLQVYCQFAAFEKAANAAGVVTGSGWSIRIGRTSNPTVELVYGARTATTGVFHASSSQPGTTPFGYGGMAVRFTGIFQ